MSTPSPRPLTHQIAGPAALVLGTEEWTDEKSRLKPTEHVTRALAKTVMLGGAPLEKLARVGWLSFPLQGRDGMFEVRVKGVRFYGARVGRVGARDVLLLLGAEQKSGQSKANAALLDRCGARLARDRDEALRLGREHGSTS